MPGRRTSPAPNISCVLSCLDHSESTGFHLLVPNFFEVSCIRIAYLGHLSEDCLVLGVIFGHKLAKLEG